MPEADIVVVLVTAPDLEVARKLAEEILRRKLAACATIVPAVESHYWWENKIESSNESLLVIKTVAGVVKTLEEMVLGAHPYETPEFLVLPVKSGAAKYLSWVRNTVLPLSATPSE